MKRPVTTLCLALALCGGAMAPDSVTATGSAWESDKARWRRAPGSARGSAA